MNCDKLNRRPAKDVLRIKSGNTVVKLYSGSIIQRGKAYPLHRISYYEAGHRVMRSFGDLDKAKAEANKVAARLEQGERDVLKMTNSDQSAFALAQNKLRKLGVPLLTVVDEYVQASKLLNGTGTLLAAAKEYGERHHHRLADKPIPELVGQFIQDREDPSERYVNTLRSRLSRFAARFKTKLANITSQDINDWLRDLNLATRTRRNILTDLRTFFNYAKGLGYLPKNEETAVEGIKLRKPKTGAIETLSPAELQKLLDAANTDQRRIYFSLAAFTGLRSEELARLEWSDIKLAEGHVELGADKAKTSARRIIPICDSLAGWLAPYSRRTGRIFESRRAPERMTAWARETLGRWPHNCLRHSFISYRVAVTHDMPRVALESGNSVQMIQKHYRELKTETSGRAWFAISPKRPSNIVPMRARGKKRAA